MQNLRKILYSTPVMLRRFLISWLSAATISYLLLPKDLRPLQSLSGVANMSLGVTLILTAIFFCILYVIGLYHTNHTLERWLLAATFSLLSVVSLISCFRWPFLIACSLISLILVIYAIFGWNNTSIIRHPQVKTHTVCTVIIAALTFLFILFVSIWTVSRVYTFSTPTYDFGIFSQMFYSMKTSGIPVTTLERDGLLSHFHVHTSPIYYLLLPVYYLFPFPATLQVLQAIVLGSAVIPLWLVCRKNGLSPTETIIICAMLLVYPSFSGGTSYDIHENAFLTPLILSLLYCIDSRNSPFTILFFCLTLLVKEDAAVYVAVVAVYLLAKSVLTNSQHRNWGIITGISMLMCSVIYFVFVTGYLSSIGDGVMTGRYNNFMYGGSASLLTVIKTVILCPMKVLFESVDPEKLEFIHLTLFPLLGIPLFTRRYERYLLLIPYVLVNLMSDYQYQHDIFFQYTYGSTALLFYLTAVNLADIKLDRMRLGVSVLALLCGIVSFKNNVVPVAEKYPSYYREFRSYYAQISEVLDTIPDDASVSSTTYYTTYLSQRETLYDVKYTSREHLLSTEYVVLSKIESTSYKQYESAESSGYENLCHLLESEDFEVFAELNQTLIIYRKKQ